jgi:hypothetical protein
VFQIEFLKFRHCLKWTICLNIEISYLKIDMSKYRHLLSKYRCCFGYLPCGTMLYYLYFRLLNDTYLYKDLKIEVVPGFTDPYGGRSLWNFSLHAFIHVPYIYGMPLISSEASILLLILNGLILIAFKYLLYNKWDVTITTAILCWHNCSLSVC